MIENKRKLVGLTMLCVGMLVFSFTIDAAVVRRDIVSCFICATAFLLGISGVVVMCTEAPKMYRELFGEVPWVRISTLAHHMGNMFPLHVWQFYRKIFDNYNGFVDVMTDPGNKYSIDDEGKCKPTGTSVDPQFVCGISDPNFFSEVVGVLFIRAEDAERVLKAWKDKQKKKK